MAVDIPFVGSRYCGGFPLTVGPHTFFYYDGELLAYKGPAAPYGMRRPYPKPPHRAWSTTRGYMRRLDCLGFEKMKSDEAFHLALNPGGSHG